MEIIYRELAADEIAPALFNDFVRRQEVKRCWRKSNGEWVLKDIAFIDDWSRDDYLKLVDDLKRTVREGGFVCAAFAGGVLSGIVEPIGAVLTIMAARLIVPALPYLLSFAAGAMLYVVVEELIPEMSQGTHTNVGTIFFAIGFSLMMVLDVALG